MRCDDGKDDISEDEIAALSLSDTANDDDVVVLSATNRNMLSCH